MTNNDGVTDLFGKAQSEEEWPANMKNCPVGEFSADSHI